MEQREMSYQELSILHNYAEKHNPETDKELREEFVFDFVSKYMGCSSDLNFEKEEII